MFREQAQKHLDTPRVRVPLCLLVQLHWFQQTRHEHLECVRGCRLGLGFV